MINRYLLVIVVLVVLSGCGGFQAVKIDNMVAKGKSNAFISSNKSCYLKDFESRNIDYVKYTDLMKAIEASLLQSKAFATVYTAENNKADYTLSAKILGTPLDRRLNAFTQTFKVSMYIAYNLKRTDTNTSVFSKIIKSDYTFPENENGSTGFRMTYEGATRENIDLLLQELSKIEL